MDANPATLHAFISVAYWRSAAFNQLRMSSQADEQTRDLLKFAMDEETELTTAERALIHYARGRYYLDAGADYDAIVCFEKALDWNSSLERALRDRIRAYRNFDGYAALYYSMLAIHTVPESFDLRSMLTITLLDAQLWGLAENEARSLMVNYPHQQPVALTFLAQAMAGQGRINEALEYCTRALELDDKNPEALNQMTLLIESTTRSTAQEVLVGIEADLVAGPPLLEPEVRPFSLDTAESVRGWLKEALKHQNVQDYVRALELFDLILEIEPDNIEAICGRVNCLRRTHKFLEAKAEAGGAIERNLSSWQLYVELGRLLHGEGDYSRALEWYDKADAEQNRNIEVSIARSNTLCAQGNVGAAGNLINELLKMNKDSFPLLEELAWISFYRGNYGSAEVAFREIHEKAYNSFQSHPDEERVAEMAKASYGLGYVAMKQGDNSGALSHFLEARDRFDIADYRLAHAWAQAQTEDKSQLENALNTCLKLARDTGSPLAFNCLGVIYFKLGDRTDAKTNFEKAAKIGPAYACHVDLGALYASLEDTVEAEREFREAIRLDPNDADAHYELGVLLLSSQDKENLKSAEYEFKRAKAIDPYSVRAVLGLSRCFRLDGRTAEAEQELRRAIKQFGHVRRSARQSDLWRLYVELATLLIDRGNKSQDNKLYSSAYGEACAAIRLADTAWETHYMAAVAAERCGHFRTAAFHWRNCRDRGGDPVSVESFWIDYKSTRIEARMKFVVPFIAGSFALCLFLFIVLDLAKLDVQSTGVLLTVFATFIIALMLTVFPHRLMKFSIAKIVSAELAAPSEQSLPVGPIGQLPAVGDRFDLPPRPFGQQLRRN